MLPNDIKFTENIKLNTWEGEKKKNKGNYPTVLKATGFLILLSEQLPTQACEIDGGKKERSEKAAARITLNSTGQPER